MNFAVELLSHAGYIMYNKTLARALGVNAAVMVGELCAWHQYAADAGTLEQRAGWFCLGRETIAHDTGLTAKQQRGALQTLAARNLVESRRMGVPARLFYRLHTAELSALFAEKETSGGDVKALQDVTKGRAFFIDKKNNDKKEQSPPFQKPDLHQVAAYCAQRKNNIDAAAFVDYYEARGWMLQRTRMRDWKAAVRTWERRAANQNEERRTILE